MMKKVLEEKIKRTKEKTKRIKNLQRKNLPKMYSNKFYKTFTAMQISQVMIFLSWKMKNLTSF